MKTVAVVPIKLNNERFPNKNLKKFKTSDKTLLTTILEKLVSAKNIDEVYVFCSNETVKEYMPETVKFLKRGTHLDSSSATGTDLMNDFTKEINADIYVLAHATAPFLSVETIETGVNAVKSGKYDSAFTVNRLQEFLWVNGKPLNYDLTNIPRTQDLLPTYSETCAMFVFENFVATKLNRRIGEKPYLIEVSKIEALDIDEAIDFQIAEAVFLANIKE